MKVVILSKKDYAGSGFKMYESLLRHTDIKVSMYVGEATRYGHEQGKVINDYNIKIVQQDVDDADIIHLKGDWAHDGSYCGLDLKNKPVIISVSGSLFRKRDSHGLEKFKISDYDNCDVKTAMTPDLCYDGFSDIWIPHPIDVENAPVLWKYRDTPLLSHSPTNRKIKGTDFVADVFGRVKSVMDCETLLIEGIPFDEADKMRKEATVFFDQFNVGFYGNSAIEAMQYGIPVVAWISWDLVREDLIDCPVFSASQDIDLWFDDFIGFLRDKSFMQLWSKLTRNWCKKTHSYKAVADKLYKLYNQL